MSNQPTAMAPLDSDSHRLDLFMASMHGFAWEADPTTLQFTFVSPAAEQLLGYAGKLWLTPNFWAEHLHPIDRGRVVGYCRQAIAEQRSHHCEYRLISASGQALLLRHTAGVEVAEGVVTKIRGFLFVLPDEGEAKNIQPASVTPTNATEDQGYIWFLENLDKVNQAIHGTNDLNQMMIDVLDTLLAIFACDRAWLVYPCDPEASTWQTPMERTRPEYPGVLPIGKALPLDPIGAAVFRLTLAADGPVKFGPQAEHAVPEIMTKFFQVQSMLILTLYPKVGKPWNFGFHQCSYARVWTAQEERLFQEIGRRIADALSTLLAYRNLQENEARYRAIFELSHDYAYTNRLESDGSFVAEWFTPGAQRITGYDEVETFTPGFWQKLVHPDDQLILRRHIELLLAGQADTAEGRIITKSGEVRWLRDSAYPVWDATQGRATSFFGGVRDITARKQMEEELRASEERFRTFVEHAADAFFLHDIGGNILDVNHQACVSLGYSRAELLGMNPATFDLDTTPEMLQQITARLLTGETITLETRHRRKDGSIFPVEVRIRPLLGIGEPRSISLVRDITERKQTEKDLTLFRTLLDHITEGIEILDPVTGRFLDVNEQTCRSHGYTRAEYLNLSLSDIAPGFTTQHLTDYMKLGVQGQQAVLEAQHCRKDGSHFPVEVTVNLVQLDQAYVIALVRDITERKRTEQALTESHNLLNAVFEGASDAIFVKDLQGCYLMVNSAGALCLGKPARAVIGKTDREIFPPEYARIAVEQDRQISISGTPMTFEYTVPTPNGIRFFLSTKSTYRDANGQTIGIIGIMRDVTDLKRLEEQFRQAQKMEAVGQLAGGIAHDFNNLLTVINGYSGLVHSRLPADDPNRKRLAEIQKAGERAANLTRQLLAFSRKQVLQPQVVNLNTLLGELLKLLQRLISEDIEVTLTPDAISGLVKVDPGQFEQAIINLAVNARDAMPEGGQLLIRTADVILDSTIAQIYPEVKPGWYVQVTVSDSGQGMDEPTRSRIFEPFFTTKEQGKGTGLGLAMVYGFVKQSDGHIEVESAPGSGTTFKVYLPRAEEALPIVKSATELAGIPTGTETILLVEDEEAVRQLFAQTLQTHGYTVLEANDGQEAVAIAQQHVGSIHLLVTDLVMPRLNGRQLADTLLQTRPDLCILFISGYTNETVVRHGVHAGSVLFLQKPFGPLDLLHKISEVLAPDKVSE